jgi:hypothetical protein
MSHETHSKLAAADFCKESLRSQKPFPYHRPRPQARTMRTSRARAQRASREVWRAPEAGYQSLAPDEAGFVETLVNVMWPADHLTPSGVDCGLAVYIDRQLAGGFGKGERLYMRGPWKPGKPQAGLSVATHP